MGRPGLMGQSVLIGSPSFLAMASPAIAAPPAGASAAKVFNAVPFLLFP